MPDRCSFRQACSERSWRRRERKLSSFERTSTKFAVCSTCSPIRSTMPLLCSTIPLLCSGVCSSCSTARTHGVPCCVTSCSRHLSQLLRVSLFDPVVADLRLRLGFFEPASFDSHPACSTRFVLESSRSQVEETGRRNCSKRLASMQLASFQLCRGCISTGPL